MASSHEADRGFDPLPQPWRRLGARVNPQRPSEDETLDWSESDWAKEFLRQPRLGAMRAWPVRALQACRIDGGDATPSQHLASLARVRDPIRVALVSRC